MANIFKSASAEWQGDLKRGNGHLSTETGVLKENVYTSGAAAAKPGGTNPEELLAAAHAGCFTMQLTALISADGHTVNSIKTEVKCELGKDEKGFVVVAMHIDTRGSVEGIDAAQFEAYVEKAAGLCPLSRVVSGNARIEHNASFE